MVWYSGCLHGSCAEHLRGDSAHTKNRDPHRPEWLQRRHPEASLWRWKDTQSGKQTHAEQEVAVGKALMCRTGK